MHFAKASFRLTLFSNPAVYAKRREKSNNYKQPSLLRFERCFDSLEYQNCLTYVRPIVRLQRMKKKKKKRMAMKKDDEKKQKKKKKMTLRTPLYSFSSHTSTRATSILSFFFPNPTLLYV